MEIWFGAGIFAAVITAGMIKLLQPFAYWTHLVDKPGGRKKHEGVVPLIGGIAIFTGVFFAGYIFLDQPLFIRFFMLGCGFIVFLGALDDRYQLSPRFRLIGQALIASIFVYGLDLSLSNFGNLLGFGDIKVGALGYILAVLSLVAVVNAFNMLDGVDGLIGSIGSVSFIGLATLFAVAGQTNIAVLCVIFSASTMAFLIFNVWGSAEGQKTLGKVFMGDAGSMLVGLAVGVLLIAGTQIGVTSFQPAAALWIVLLPMTDMFTLMYRRVKRGKSPVAPDRTHLHHIIIRAGYGKKQTAVMICALQAGFVGFAILATSCSLPDAVVFAAAVLFGFLYQLFMRRSWRFIRWSKRHLFAPSAKGA